MPAQIPERIRHLMEDKLNEAKFFAIKEATKARRWAITSFASVVATFTVLLGISGYLGIPKLIEQNVNDFLKREGAAQTLRNLTEIVDSAKATRDSTSKELEKARGAANEIRSLAANFPTVVGLLETQVGADYPEQGGTWFPVPYQDNKILQQSVTVDARDNLFLVVFKYRVKGSPDGIKLSRVNVLTRDENSIRSMEADGGSSIGSEFATSSSLFVTGLQKGGYILRVEHYDGQRAVPHYEPGRQLLVYRLK